MSSVSSATNRLSTMALQVVTRGTTTMVRRQTQQTSGSTLLLLGTLRLQPAIAATTSDGVRFFHRGRDTTCDQVEESSSSSSSFSSRTSPMTVSMDKDSSSSSTSSSSATVSSRSSPRVVVRTMSPGPGPTRRRGYGTTTASSTRMVSASSSSSGDDDYYYDNNNMTIDFYNNNGTMSTVLRHDDQYSFDEDYDEWSLYAAPTNNTQSHLGLVTPATCAEVASRADEVVPPSHSDEVVLDIVGAIQQQAILMSNSNIEEVEDDWKLLHEARCGAFFEEDEDDCEDVSLDY